jgi:putative chitinase
MIAPTILTTICPTAPPNIAPTVVDVVGVQPLFCAGVTGAGVGSGMSLVYAPPLMFVISTQQLSAAVPKCANPEAWAASLNNAALMYGIAADRAELIEWLTQCAHESQQFTRLEENLYYTADRLVEIWPKRFPSLTVANNYARNPHKLADFVYADRMGNGPEYTGDGWRFRGRGLIMATGKSNYLLLMRLLGYPDLMACPDKLCTRAGASLSAAALWANNPKLRALAKDEANDDDYADFVSITRIVNGGTTGLAERASLRKAFTRVFE